MKAWKPLKSLIAEIHPPLSSTFNLNVGLKYV